ncbi:MAG: hypothetical protein KAJ48_02770 [Elusimicrobiales bacterium]|nr:hypothetical protein [Elusimicrobiales bacterium]
MNFTDIHYLMELIFLIAIPFVPIAIGILLRRKYHPSKENVSSQKGMYILASILFYSGILALIFCFIIVLNFAGVL